MKLSTLVSLAPGGSIHAPARHPLDVSTKSDFGALLGGMAMDASAGTMPASAADALVPDTGEEGETGSRQRASSSAEGEPQPPVVSTVTAPTLVGVPRVTSLMTLATRAAEQGSGVVPASAVSSPIADSVVAPGGRHPGAAGSSDDVARASGLLVRRRFESADDDPAGAVAPTNIAVPTAVAALLVAPGAVVPATTPAAVPAEASAPGAGTDADPPSNGIVPPGANDAPQLPAPPAITKPAVAADEIDGARDPAAAATSGDVAIVRGSVRVESHLGFDGSFPFDTAASPDEVARSVSPTTKAAVDDEPNAPADDIAGPLAVTPAEGIAMPIGQAAPRVAQQVADGVAGLAAIVVPDEPGSAAKAAPARTMALQVSPAGLGTLTIRLHVAGRALDVHVEASDGRTAALIDRDRAALAGALRGKDYELKTLSVTTHDATMPGGSHAERGNEARSADAGAADTGSPGRSRDGPSGDRSSGGGAREAPERAARPSSRPADEAFLERGGSSLFV